MIGVKILGAIIQLYLQDLVEKLVLKEGNYRCSADGLKRIHRMLLRYETGEWNENKEMKTVAHSGNWTGTPNQLLRSSLVVLGGVP